MLRLALNADHPIRAACGEKTDERDALQLLELLRWNVWRATVCLRCGSRIAKPATIASWCGCVWTWERDSTALKTQVQSLLKRRQLRRPKTTGKGWTTAFWKWLEFALAEPVLPKSCPLARGGQAALSSLLRQLRWLEEEQARLDEEVYSLAEAPRYAAAIREMTQECGVGILTALAFLAEMGDLGRFANRRRIAAYLGLAPTSNESGEASDRKGSHYALRAPAACEKCSARRRGLGCVGTRREKRFTIALRRRTANTRRLPWWPACHD